LGEIHKTAEKNKGLAPHRGSAKNKNGGFKKITQRGPNVSKKRKTPGVKKYFPPPR